VASSRRNEIVLTILVVVLAAVMYRLWAPTAGTAPRSADRSSQSRTETVPARAAAPDVRLSALEAERPKPGEADRNLFRFKPKPPARVSAPPPTAPVAVAPSGPPPPPPIPPIALKFIGTLELPQRAKKVAVLRDEYGGVYHAAEGETVLGQYRVLRIGAESIDVMYVNGRGRQTIRLGG
jgi:hypothetical protein